MPSFLPAKFPHCPGNMSIDPVSNAPTCDQPWQAIQTLAIDPSASSILTVLLDQGGVDWSTVEWIFGSGLILFATGAGVGAVVQIVRKARNL